MKVNGFNYLIILIVVCAFAATGCNKEGETAAVITITTDDNKPVSGAKVYLHADGVSGPGDFDTTQTTDASGVTKFIFKLEAIYTIEATKDTLFGVGSVRLEKGNTVEETVIIY